jgi:hypothetical protein
VVFTEFTHPPESNDGVEWKFWGPCPDNGEPILLRVTQSDESI